MSDTGNEITKLQKCLREDGKYNYSSGLTGYYGNYTHKIQNISPVLNEQVSDCDAIIRRKYFKTEKNNNVALLQKCLKTLKFYNYEGGITGYYGDITDLALKNYLNSNNNACSILIKATYSYGESSARVKKLQQCLKDKGIIDQSFHTNKFDLKTILAIKKITQ